MYASSLRDITYINAIKKVRGVFTSGSYVKRSGDFSFFSLSFPTSVITIFYNSDATDYLCEESVIILRASRPAAPKIFSPHRSTLTSLLLLLSRSTGRGWRRRCSYGMPELLI